MSRSRGYPGRSYFLASSASSDGDENEDSDTSEFVPYGPPSPSTTCTSADVLSPKIDVSDSPVQPIGAGSRGSAACIEASSKATDKSYSSLTASYGSSAGTIKPKGNAFQYRGRRILNCDHCRKRKSRCDRVQPKCGECSSRDLSCCWSISNAPPSLAPKPAVIYKPRTIVSPRPMLGKKSVPIAAELYYRASPTPSEHLNQLLAFSSEEVIRLLAQQSSSSSNTLSRPVLPINRGSVGQGNHVDDKKVARSHYRRSEDSVIDRHGPTSKRSYTSPMSPRNLPTPPQSPHLSIIPTMTSYTASSAARSHLSQTHPLTSLSAPSPSSSIFSYLSSAPRPELQRPSPPLRFRSNYIYRPASEAKRPAGHRTKSDNDALSGISSSSRSFESRPGSSFSPMGTKLRDFGQPVTDERRHLNDRRLSSVTLSDSFNGSGPGERNASRSPAYHPLPSIPAPRSFYQTSPTSTEDEAYRRSPFAPYPSPPETNATIPSARLDPQQTIHLLPAAEIFVRPSLKRIESVDMTIEPLPKRRAGSTSSASPPPFYHRSRSTIRLPSIRSLFLLRDSNENGATLYQSVSVLGMKQSPGGDEALPSIKRWYPSHQLETELEAVGGYSSAYGFNNAKRMHRDW